MMKKYLFFAISMFIVMTVLTGCHNDEPGIQDDDDDASKIEFPTEDIITGTYPGNYAIIGSSDYDEVTQYVLKRLTGASSSYSPTGDFIADDVRLVFLNNDALLSLEKPMVMQLKKVVENGGYIYVHKPNSLAMVFLSLAIYYDLDQALDDLKHGKLARRGRADTDEASLECDSYIVGPKLRTLILTDVYTGLPIEIEIFNPETNDKVTETIKPKVPDAYEYGHIAENIVEWLNEDISTSKSRGLSRVNSDVLDTASDTKFIIGCHIYQKYASGTYGTKTETIDKSFDASCRVWISDLYNFERDEDYYHIVLEQTFEGSECYYGQYCSYKTDKLFKYRIKEAGFAYSSAYVKPTFKNVSGQNGTLTDAWNPQPESKGVTTTTETVSGWSIGGEVGFDSGITGNLSASLTNEQTVTEIDPAISVGLKNGGSRDFSWDFKLKNELYYKKGSAITNATLHEPASTSPSRTTCKTRQSWNWLVKGTKNRGNSPFTFDVEMLFRVMYAYTAGGFGTKTDTEERAVNSSNKTFSVTMPVPNRHKMTYSMSCENAVLSEWAALKEEIVSHDRENFSKLNATRCAPTEELVDQRTAELWNKTIAGVAARISTFNHLEKDEYVIVLKNNVGKVIGKKLIVTAKGAHIE